MYTFSDADLRKLVQHVLKDVSEYMKSDTPQGQMNHRQGMGRSATILYMLMALFGIMINQYFHKEHRQAFALPTTNSDLFDWLVLSAIATVVLLGSSRLLEDVSANFRELKSSLIRLLGPISLPMVIYLAATSAIGEEFFFRAALLPWLGVVGSSVVFGLMHLGPQLRPSMWSLWAFGAGLLLGTIYVHSSSIWPPVLIHFLVNLFSLCRIRVLYRSRQSDAA